jgi:prophage antirepressor-like protein
MNEIQIFKNKKFGEIRTVVIEDKPYFVGNDIAGPLGYKRPHRAISRHCKGVMKHDIPTKGGNQQMNVIPESDVYRLIINSELPEAEKFERWVFEEVLPSIRKHGAYMTPKTIEEALLNPDTIIKLATKLKEEQAINRKQQQIIGELKPKADYTDTILKNKGLVTITQIAKDYGMSGQAMNKILYDLEIQYKQSGQWLLYREHQGKGYTHSETVEITRSNGMPDIKMNTKWTQKGRLFLYEVLKKNDILPDIEKIAS